MHGLIFETSIWLLAGSTRLLPNQRRPSERDRHRSASNRRLVGRRNRIHHNRKPTRNPMGIEFSIPSLQLWLRSWSDASYSREKQLCLKTSPRQGRALGFQPRDAVGMRPDARNLCSFPSNPTHWVAHNRESPHSSLTPRRTARAKHVPDKSQVRTQTQLGRVGSQDAGRCTDQPQKGQSSERSDPPYSIHRCAPTVNKRQKVQFLHQKSQKIDFWRCKPMIFSISFCKRCKMIRFGLPHGA